MYNELLKFRQNFDKLFRPGTMEDKLECY